MTDWPIFVLSLKDAVDRRRPLVEQLGAHGLKFELFDAIDGRKGLPPEMEERVDRQQTRRNIARDMTDAEYACALSHLAIYQTVLDRESPGAIVLEDDAVLDRRFPIFYREGAYSGADLVLFDHSYSRVWRLSTRRMTAEVSAARFSLCPSLATGYSISARGCCFMLQNSFPLSRTADWPCDITQIGALATIPRLVDHPPDEQPGSSLETARKASIQKRYWSERDRQTGGFETRKWKRWILKRLSIRLA
jgi:glycosyl transferase family 25